MKVEENYAFCSSEGVRGKSVCGRSGDLVRLDTDFWFWWGVADSDDKQIADKMIDKLTKLRIFDDADGKTNLSAADVGGEFLIISQFTLYADCRKGNRPSFTLAGNRTRQTSCMNIVFVRLRKRVSCRAWLLWGRDEGIALE